MKTRISQRKGIIVTDTIVCQICGDEHHITLKHLQEKHPETTIDAYREQFPDAPILSERARIKLAEIAKQREKDAAMAKGVTKGKAPITDGSKRPMHEVFDIPASVKGVKSKKGDPVMISVLSDSDSNAAFVPPVDPHYIYDVETLKDVLMGLELNMNVYAVGHAGTGKSTLATQVCARTNRPVLRVQHTVNTEEAHILGQYVVKGGDTVWEPGPLQICMKHGIVYLADEYDRATPQVLSLYQPVLEGAALVTKEAPPEWRIIEPHPNFRFLATGNTNGAGDETGLYPSTALQDFANYERFTMMLEVGWLPKNQETKILVDRVGILKEDAERLVDFAADVRKRFEAGEISAPISPRALIGAAKIARFRGGKFRHGLHRAFLSRLTQVDREACDQVAQRYFGSD